MSRVHSWCVLVVTTGGMGHTGGWGTPLAWDPLLVYRVQIGYCQLALLVSSMERTNAMLPTVVMI